MSDLEGKSHSSEADKEWKVEPVFNHRGKWMAGYVCRGESGTHQGQFAPVHLFPSVDAARIFVDAMNEGRSRREAKVLAD